MTFPYIQHTATGELFTDNFTTEELRCKCTVCKGKMPHHMLAKGLQKHQELRLVLKRPYRPNSAFRCSLHVEERYKETPGEHNRTAMDIPCSNGVQKGQVVKEAIAIGATGIGVYDWGVHVDFREGPLVMW